MKRAKQLLLDAGLGLADTCTRTSEGKKTSRTQKSKCHKYQKREHFKAPLFTEKSFGRDGLNFGGSLLKNSHAKSERVLDSKKPIHLVVRSTQAKGRKSFLYSGQKIESTIRRHAKNKGVRIYEMANGGNHIHIIMRIPKQRSLYAAFVRGFTGELARMMTGAKKGKKTFSKVSRDLGSPARKGRPSNQLDTSIASKNAQNNTPTRFWDHKPFTRILSSWGKDFVGLRKYLQTNNCETILGMRRTSSRNMLSAIYALQNSGQLEATGFG